MMVGLDLRREYIYKNIIIFVSMDKIDIIYYINLAHRTDRDKRIRDQLLNHAGIDPSKVHRIDAIYVPDFGALGCSKSHIKILEEFVKTPDSVKNCLILEDDFVFNMPIEDVNDLLNKFWDAMNDDYDVLMLGCNPMATTPTEFPFMHKIIEAWTTSAYCVNKTFASRLLENMKEGAKLLEAAGKPTHEYSLDIYMKHLQKKYNWYTLYPKIGRQGNSYSDVEKKYVDYGL